MQDSKVPPDISATIVQRASVFDVPGQAVIATTADGRIVYWGHSATSLYGWTRDEVIGRDVLEVTPAATSADQAAGIMTQLMGGRTWSGEFKVRRRDGSEFPACVRNVPVRNEADELIGIIGVSEPARK